jgi:hypothetical protein
MTPEELVAQFAANQENAQLREELYQRFVRGSDEERGLIRTAVFRSKLSARFERWIPFPFEQDPTGWIERRLTIIALTDGYPDPRDAFMTTSWMATQAPKHQVDYQAILRRVLPMASARVKLMFTGNLNLALWHNKN